MFCYPIIRISLNNSPRKIEKRSFPRKTRKMDCELVRLAGVPIGLVTSALFYSTDIGSSGREDQEVIHVWIAYAHSS